MAVSRVHRDLPPRPRRAVLPLVIEEPGSQITSRPWDQAERVVPSRLVYPEGRAALAMALRRGNIDEQEVRTAIDAFGILHGQLHVVEVTEGLVRSAGVKAEQFVLRGYDVVHLASVQEIADPDVVLAAGDRGLLAAAEVLGIAMANLKPASLYETRGGSSSQVGQDL
ncbi:MAG: type II toxin-antitoxin system VapC family toxin [Acidimicrobiales bacterium]